MHGKELLDDQHSCDGGAGSVTRSDMWEHWETTCCSCKTKEQQQQQENQIINTQTKNKTIKT